MANGVQALKRAALYMPLHVSPSMPAGNVYFTESGTPSSLRTPKIRKIAPNGIITTVAGETFNTATEFQPFGRNRSRWLGSGCRRECLSDRAYSPVPSAKWMRNGIKHHYHCGRHASGRPCGRRRDAHRMLNFAWVSITVCRSQIQVSFTWPMAPMSVYDRSHPAAW